MELNINDEIKIRILKQLSDGKVYSFYLLAKKIKANNTTVKKAPFGCKSVVALAKHWVVPIR